MKESTRIDIEVKGKAKEAPIRLETLSNFNFYLFENNEDKRKTFVLRANEQVLFFKDSFSLVTFATLPYTSFTETHTLIGRVKNMKLSGELA